MNFNTKRQIYECMPLWSKKAIGYLPFSVLAGKPYRATRRACKKYDGMRQDEIVCMQESLLRSLLEFATTKVPAYVPFRGRLGKASPFELLRTMPLLDRVTLLEQPQEYISADSASRPHYATTTGGTSGQQLRILQENDSHSIETAHIHDMWRRVNYQAGARRATFRGAVLHEIRPERNLFWQLNPIYAELQLSPFHLSETTLDDYCRAISGFRPRFLHGYPSAIGLLANLVEKRHGTWQGERIEGVLLASEACAGWQREVIERVFGARVFTWYGHSERLILAGECEVDPSYHHCPGYGILEVLNEQGEPCRQGEFGEIVGTALTNRIMPLIRYRTGDFAVVESSTCRCGRFWQRFSQVQGRWGQDMLRGRSGSQFSIAALNLHGDLFQDVVRYQYVQDSSGHCEIRIVPGAGFTEAAGEAILKEYNAKTKGELSFDLRIVDEIPLTAIGKWKMLVKGDGV